VVLSRREGKQDGLIASVVVPPDLIYTSAIKPADVQNVQDIPDEEPGLTGRLKSLGITVSLPELPLASSPASILFLSKNLPVEEPPTPVKVPVHAKAPVADPATVRAQAPVQAPAQAVARQTVAHQAVSQRAVAQQAAQEQAVSQQAVSHQNGDSAQDFAWLGGGVPSAPAQQPLPRQTRPFVNTAPQKEGELPKRVPKAQLFAGSVETKASGNGGKRSAVPPRPPASAERARGFLSSFQAGIRQSKADEGEEKP
jgi:hypothetical protein